MLVRCSLALIRFIFHLRSRLGRFYICSLWLNLKEMLGLKLGNLANLVLCGIDPTYRWYYLLRPCSLACKNGFLVCNRTRFRIKTYMNLHSRKSPTGSLRLLQSFHRRNLGIIILRDKFSNSVGRAVVL